VGMGADPFHMCVVQIFNRICFDQGSRPMDWERPYVTQVASRACR
jgi:hypothetical protein